MVRDSLHGHRLSSLSDETQVSRSGITSSGRGLSTVSPQKSWPVGTDSFYLGVQWDLSHEVPPCSAIFNTGKYSIRPQKMEKKKKKEQYGEVQDGQHQPLFGPWKNHRANTTESNFWAQGRWLKIANRFTKVKSDLNNITAFYAEATSMDWGKTVDIVCLKCIWNTVSILEPLSPRKMIINFTKPNRRPLKWSRLDYTRWV